MIFDIFDDSFEPPFLRCPALPLRGPCFVRGGGISRFRSQTVQFGVDKRSWRRFCERGQVRRPWMKTPFGWHALRASRGLGATAISASVAAPSGWRII